MYHTIMSNYIAVEKWQQKLKGSGFRAEDNAIELVRWPLPAWQCEPKKEPYQSIFEKKPA